MVNVAQMVCLLPHERYELYMDAVDKLHKIITCLTNHTKCNILIGPAKKVACLWPFNHADKTMLKDKTEIQSIPVTSQYRIKAAGLQYQARNQIEEGTDAEKRSNAQLDLLLKKTFQRPQSGCL